MSILKAGFGFRSISAMSGGVGGLFPTVSLDSALHVARKDVIPGQTSRMVLLYGCSLSRKAQDDHRLYEGWPSSVGIMLRRWVGCNEWILREVQNTISG